MTYRNGFPGRLKELFQQGKNSQSFYRNISDIKWVYSSISNPKWKKSGKMYRIGSIETKCYRILHELKLKHKALKYILSAFAENLK
jgi:hypothetical protein